MFTLLNDSMCPTRMIPKTDFFDMAEKHEGDHMELLQQVVSLM